MVQLLVINRYVLSVFVAVPNAERANGLCEPRFLCEQKRGMITSRK